MLYVFLEVPKTKKEIVETGLTKEQIYKITHTFARTKGECVYCNSNKPIYSIGLCRKCWKMLKENDLLPKKHHKCKLNAPKNGYSKIRNSVLERDNYKCVECGSNKNLNVHHNIHRSDGGSNSEDNLVTLCGKCHMDKHKGEVVHSLMWKRLEG